MLLPGGWLRTGDLGWLDVEGQLWLVGRAKDMVKSGGENVSAAEVEAALEAHPDVLEAAVVGLPDDRLGELVRLPWTGSAWCCCHTEGSELDFWRKHTLTCTCLSTHTHAHACMRTHARTRTCPRICPHIACECSPRSPLPWCDTLAGPGVVTGRSMPQGAR